MKASIAEQLSQLADLHDAGVLSADDFDRAKKRLLGATQGPPDGPMGRPESGASAPPTGRFTRPTQDDEGALANPMERPAEGNSSPTAGEIVGEGANDAVAPSTPASSQPPTPPPSAHARWNRPTTPGPFGSSSASTPSSQGEHEPSQRASSDKKPTSEAQPDSPSDVAPESPAHSSSTPDGSAATGSTMRENWMQAPRAVRAIVYGLGSLVGLLLLMGLVTNLTSTNTSLGPINISVPDDGQPICTETFGNQQLCLVLLVFESNARDPHAMSGVDIHLVTQSGRRFAPSVDSQINYGTYQFNPGQGLLWDGEFSLPADERIRRIEISGDRGRVRIPWQDDWHATSR